MFSVNACINLCITRDKDDDEKKAFKKEQGQRGARPIARRRERRQQHQHLYKKLPLEDESPFLFQSHFRRGIGSGLSGVFLQRLREFPQLVPFSRLRVVVVVGGGGRATSSSTRRGHRHRRALLRVNVYDVHTRRKSRYRIVCVP